MPAAAGSSAAMGAPSCHRGDDKQRVVWMIVGKITHPLKDVRKRALDSLVFKLDHGLLQVADLAEDQTAIRNLLEWFNLPDCDEEETVINLLQRLARNEAAAVFLADVGAEGFFRKMREEARPELKAPIDRLLGTIVELPYTPPPAAPASAGTGGAPSGVAFFAPRHSVAKEGDSYEMYANTAARQAALSAASKDPRVGRALERMGVSEKMESALAAAAREVEEGGLALQGLVFGVGDEQWLFDLNVKLQFSEEPRTLQAALRELSDAAVGDLPVHAVLQRQGLLDNVLALLHTTDDSPVQSAALRAVHAVVLSIRAALALAADAGLSAAEAGPPAPPGEEGDDKHLARSYPAAGRAAAAAARPAPRPEGARGESEGKPEVIRVSPAAHLIAVNLLSLLSTARLHPEALPAFLDLVPLLAPPEGPLSPQGSARFRQYFSTLADATRFFMPALPPAEGGGEPAALNPAAANVLTAAAHLLPLLPPGGASEVVPPEVSARLGALACDHVEAACVPGVRELVLPHLPELQPRLHACHVAEAAAHEALLAMEAVGHEDAAAAAMEGPRRDECLAAIVASMPSLLYTGDAAAVGRFVRLLCVRPYDEAMAPGWAEESAPALLALLRLRDGALRGAAMAALTGQMAGGAPDAGAFALVLAPGVMEEVATRGLWDAATKADALVLLLAALDHGDEELVAAVAAYAPYVECCEYDGELGAIAHGVASLLAERMRASPAGGAGPWPSLAPVLRSLFLADPLRRRAAAALLLGALSPGLAAIAGAGGRTGRAADDRYVDPIGSAMESWGARGWAPGSRQVGAEATGVEALITMLSNPSLGGAIQRSAADQLGALLEDPRLAHYLADARLLSLIVERLHGSSADALEAMAADSGGVDPAPPRAAGDVRSEFDCGELVATSLLHVLALASSRSAAARAWMLAEPAGRVQALLPLAFHPSDQIRRLAAVAFAYLSFDPVRKEGADVLRLPELFLSSYAFPCRAEGVPGEAAGPIPGEPDRRRTSSILEQRRLLEAHGGEDGVLRALHDDPGGSRLPADTRRRLGAALELLRLPGAVEAGLDRVAAARSHAECTEALRALRARAGGSPAAAAALARATWPRSLHRILSASPANDADRRLWLDLLPLLRAALESRAVSPSGLLVLCRAFKEAAAPVLRDGALPAAPAAAEALHAHGLAGERTLEQAQDDATRAELCTEVLDFLCDILACTLSRSDPVGCERVLSLLAGGDLIDVLVGRVVAQPSAAYGCRVRAARALRLLAAAARDTWRLGQAWAIGEDALGGPGGVREGSLWDEALARAVEPLIRHVAMVRFGGGGGAPHGGWQGKALLREGLGALKSVMDSVPAWAWEPQYLAAGGTYWLTSLLRDREASVRAAAAQVLAALVSPAAPAARAHVLASWPEAGDQMVRTAICRAECPAVRAAALRFLVAAMATSTDAFATAEGDVEPAAAAAPAATFGLEAVLRRADLWEALPSILSEAGATPALLHGAAGVLLQAALADAGGLVARLPREAWGGALRIMALADDAGVEGMAEDLGVGGAALPPHAAPAEVAADAFAAAGVAAELVFAVSHHVPEQRVRFLTAFPAVRLLSHALCVAGPGAGAGPPAAAAPAAARAARARSQMLVRVAGALNHLVFRAGGAAGAALADLHPVSPGRATAAEACAAVLRPGSHAPLDLKLATCQLVSTLTATRDLAAHFFGADIDVEAEDDEEFGGGGGEPPVGHTLCEGLAGLFFELHGAAGPAAPGARRAPPHSADGWEEVARRRAAVGAALGNALAHSAAAKQCGLRLALHARLMSAARDAHGLLSSLAAHGKPPAAEAGRKELLVQEASQSVGLLKHLLYGGRGAPAARRACATAGAVKAFGALWPLAKHEPAVMHELLGAVANLLASCSTAKRALLRDAGDTGAGEGPGVPPPGGSKRSLLAQVVAAALDPGADTAVFQLALGALQAVATSPDTLPVLLKGPLVPGVVDVLRTSLLPRPKKDRGAPARQAAVLRLLTSVASSAAGQRHVLKSPPLAGALDLVLDVAAQAKAPADDAMFLLRNLAFAPEAKSHFLSNPRVVPALLEAAEGAGAGAGAARRAALATSALWALVYNGQKVKASLRGAGAPARLRGAWGGVEQRLEDLGFNPGGAGAGEVEALRGAAQNLGVLVDLLGDHTHVSPNTTLADIQDE